MKSNNRLRSGWIVLALIALSWSSSQSLADTRMFTASWIAESLGNDNVGIGTDESKYFSFFAIPQGQQGNSLHPLCNFQSTPVTIGGAGTMFNPLGPDCTPLEYSGDSRPPKFGTLTPLGGTCAGAPASPCSKTFPLYRNPQFFTAGGAARNTLIQASTTVGGGPATLYLAPGDPNRGKGMKGAPLEGSGVATTTTAPAIPGKFAFIFPAANPAPATDGFRRTTSGSFSGTFPYLYSYTYANLRNDAGNFGVGQGFFSANASTGAGPRTMTTYTLKVDGTAVQTVTITRGANTFGGVMKLLGSYSTKVCNFYQGGCRLGYGTWLYELIGAAGRKNNLTDTNHPNASSVVTAPFTTQKSFMYFNTAIRTFLTYTNVAERWPWTTGTVTVQATGRGPHDTVVRRVGFDNRNASGVGTVQLVSPVITQWIGAAPAAMIETGGIAVMQIRFVPEPGVAASLICGMALLMVLKRYRSRA